MGKANNTYQQMVGGAAAVAGGETILVSNMTMKKAVGGHGKADKREVANGVLVFFDRNPSSRALILKLILDELWDQTDALGVGVAALREGVAACQR